MARFRRRIDSGTIRSLLTREQADELIFARLQPRFRLAMAALGRQIPSPGVVTGWMFGSRVCVVPLLADSGQPAAWQIRLWGRIRRCDDGGCVFDWTIVKPLEVPVLGGWLLFFLVVAATFPSIVGVAVLAAIWLLFECMWHAHRRRREAAQALLNRWLGDVARDL